MTILEELKSLPREVTYQDLNKLSPAARRKVIEVGKDLGDDATYAEWVKLAVILLGD